MKQSVMLLTADTNLHHVMLYRQPVSFTCVHLSITPVQSAALNAPLDWLTMIQAWWRSVGRHGWYDVNQ